MNQAKAFYHGAHARKCFFEGWYFKHRVGAQVLSVIPGVAVAEDGSRKAFVQCIHNRGSVIQYFPFAAFQADTGRLMVRVGKNEFCSDGARFALSDGRASVRADLRYGALSPLPRTWYAPSMMGPFSYLGFMECYHDVLSDGHGVHGTAEIDGQSVDFAGGRCYIEKDWGRSFPSSWVWLECSDFASDARVMVAVAAIPFLGGSFTGVLGHMRLLGKPLRLASYYGARVQAMRDEGDAFHLELAQGGDRLILDVTKQGTSSLDAPVLGDMSRVIHEDPACTLRLQLRRRGRCLFEGVGRNAGFEQAGSGLMKRPRPPFKG